MCGITGWLGPSETISDPESTLSKMRETLIHRGPDEHGQQLFEGAALGMQRLKVIDLELGSQPMHAADEKCWIVLNGEIYNYRELRDTLRAKGHEFRTNSDTEVVLHAYLEWGKEMLPRLRGMFSIAIYDFRNARSDAEGTLFLARDRFGKKPLYYARSAGFFVFSSEIKAIFKHPYFKAALNKAALAEYLLHGYTLAPQTMCMGVMELPPGSYLTAEGREFSIGSYWKPSFHNREPSDLSFPEAAKELRLRLADAVKARLVSDVPLGAFLSGGLDSAAIVACMANVSETDVRTFSIGFEGDHGFDELPFARQVAEEFGTEHQEFVVTPDILKTLPRLLQLHDQPFADSSALPTLLLSEMTKQHVTVALSGDGGDELLAGYDRFYGATNLAHLYNLIPSFLQSLFLALVSALPEQSVHKGRVTTLRRFLSAAPLPLEERYLEMVGIFSAPQVASLLSAEASSEAVEAYVERFDEAGSESELEQLLYVNATTYLPGDLLVKADRCSMGASLEVRSPFLDDRLFEFVRSLPETYKMRGSKKKLLLKEAFRGIVPSEIIERKKHGFGVPIGHWFRTSLRDYLEKEFSDARIFQDKILHEAGVRRIIHEHTSGKTDHSHRIWALLTLELWYREL